MRRRAAEEPACGTEHGLLHGSGASAAQRRCPAAASPPPSSLAVGKAEPRRGGAARPARPGPARGCPTPGGAVPAPTSGRTGSDVALTEKARSQPKKGQVRGDAALREPRWTGEVSR